MPRRAKSLLQALALLLLIGVCLAPPAAAQMVGVVRGTVSDEKGAPIPGATVSLSSRSQGVAGKGAVTAPTARSRSRRCRRRRITSCGRRFPDRRRSI